MDFVFFGEALNGIHLVLRYPAINISCNAGIERALLVRIYTQNV